MNNSVFYKFFNGRTILMIDIIWKIAYTEYVVYYGARMLWRVTFALFLYADYELSAILWAKSATMLQRSTEGTDFANGAGWTATTVQSYF